MRALIFTDNGERYKECKHVCNTCKLLVLLQDAEPYVMLRLSNETVFVRETSRPFSRSSWNDLLGQQRAKLRRPKPLIASRPALLVTEDAETAVHNPHTGGCQR